MDSGDPPCGSLQEKLVFDDGKACLSIVLFSCFSVRLDFARQLVPTLRPWQPDLSLNGYANALLLEPELLEEIREFPR